jgi:hypothetical protein
MDLRDRIKKWLSANQHRAKTSVQLANETGHASSVDTSVSYYRWVAEICLDRCWQDLQGKGNSITGCANGASLAKPDLMLLYLVIPRIALAEWSLYWL